MSKRNFDAPQGYITFALGKNYAKLAHVQALSIKTTQKINKCAVIVDKMAAEELKLLPHVFDKVIEINYEAQGWDMTQHSRAFSLTPWRETVLLESDIILTQSIDHWWPIMCQREVCLTTDVMDFRENVITSRRARQLFDENLLPNVYSGFSYFRYGEFALEFFSILRLLTSNWDWVAKEHLIKNDDPTLRSDELFALAARIVGIENVSLPISIPTFVHGKAFLWGLNDHLPWNKQLYTVWSDVTPVIGHYKQRLPLHYHNKEWINDDITSRFGRKYQELFGSDAQLRPQGGSTKSN